MDILEVKTEKDNINLDLNIEPELTVVNDDKLLGAELLIDPSKIIIIIIILQILLKKILIYLRIMKII